MTHFGAGDDSVQAQLIEPVIDEGAAGFGRQTSTPIRFGDVEGEYCLALAAPTLMETAVTDIPRFRLEDRCHQANLPIRNSQENLAEFVLSVGAAQRPASDVPAEVRICRQFAIFVDVRRLVRSEQESFSLERHRS